MGTYKVIDTTGHQVGRPFKTWKAAFEFKIMKRYDWKIINQRYSSMDY